MPSFNGVVAQFSVAGARYATAIQPYALKLFLALLFIEVLVTCLQFMLDQGDAPHYKVVFSDTSSALVSSTL